jgi:hypothetical protein
MPGAYGSPIGANAGHDLYERSSPRSCTRLGRSKAGSVQFELLDGADRLA